MKFNVMKRGALAAAILMAVAAAEASSTTRVRLINAVPGLTKVDLRLDKTVIANQVAYGGASAYALTADGTYSMDVTTLRAQTTVIPPVNTDLDDSSEDYTVLVSGSVSGNPKIDDPVLEWPRLTVPRNEADIVFIHASPDGGPVNVFIDGVLVQSAMQFQNFNGPSPCLPGKHLIEVQVAGTNLISGTFFMQGGTTNTVVFTGTRATNDGLPLLLKNFSSK